MSAPTYRAARNAKRHLVVYGVPIFVECQRRDITFDAAWIETAVAKAKEAAAEGYYPPLHVRHHGPGDDEVKPAGYFRITGAGPVTFKGAERLAIFADLVITDPNVGEDVLATRLPWRSVEIHDVESPAIDSLALLDHDAPYLELPMLLVSDPAPGVVEASPTSFARATIRNPWLAADRVDADAVVACLRRGRSARLFLETDTMTSTSEATVIDEPNAHATPVAMADAPVTEPDGDEAEAVPELPATTIDWALVEAAITSGAIPAGVLARLKSAMTADEPQALPAGDAPQAAPAASASVPGETMSKIDQTDTTSPDVVAQLASLRGENAALRARLDARDANEARRADVAAAMKRLAGRPLGADFEAQIDTFHKEHGAAAFKKFVDSYAQTFAAGGSNSMLDALADPDAKTQSAEAAAYMKHGVDAVAKAERFAREWRELSEHGATRMSEARYIEVSMHRLGFTK